MLRPLLFSASFLLMLAACERPRQSDRVEIAERYRYRHAGECSSWLYSAKTGFEYCASPALTVSVKEPVPPPVKKPDGPVTQAALMERGEEVYGSVCSACHGPEGLGQAGMYPPLAGAGSFYGSPQNMANIIVNGLSGPIEVLGVRYEGAMPAQGQLSDYEIAAVATFVRSSWGNDDGMVTPDDVKAVRPK